MSLLDAYAEEFYKMDQISESDGASGFHTVWKEGVKFKLIQRHNTTIEAQKAEQDGVTSVYTFLFDKRLPLGYYDVVKRARDGQCFRITQPSGEDYTPNTSSLNLGMVTAEKWKIPT